MFDIFLPPPAPSLLEGFLSVMTYCANVITREILVDEVNTVILVVLLVCIDTFLRMLTEATEYNKAIGRDNTILNIIWTLLWRGWGPLEVAGKRKRYLASKGLRVATYTKFVKHYPWYFILSMVIMFAPDTETLGLRTDILLSQFFMYCPVVYELSSIIEKLRALDARNIVIVERMLAIVERILK